MLRFQHYKGCYCLPLLIQGEILGPNSPQLYSPGSHLRLRKAGSAHRCTLTALPGRVTPTCVNTADIYSHAEAPARYRVLLEVTGQSRTQGAKRCCITPLSAARGRGTSSVRRCRIRSALQPAFLLAWAVGEDIPNHSLNLAYALLWIASTRVGIALAVSTSCIPASQQDINIYKKPRL